VEAVPEGYIQPLKPPVKIKRHRGQGGARRRQDKKPARRNTRSGRRARQG
jgi:hypothetical protein